MQNIMNCFVAIVLFCYLGSVLGQDCKCGVEMPMSRIIGGHTVSSLSKMPWIAMLTDTKGNQFCGASIISSKAVLTAAHCTKGAKPNEIKVVMGTLKRKVDPKKMLAVSKIIVHKGYSARTVKNDISILILEEEINLDRHPPICIPSERESYYKLCVAGWGDTKNGAKLGSLNLLEVCFPENDPELCSDEDEEFSINPDQQIAAGDKGKDTCQGDSGGPLYTTIDDKNTQVGIVSYGKACGQKCAVYTRVSAYSTWIQSTLAKNKGGKQCV